MTEEAPKMPVQIIAEKLELMSGERIEKNFPGLKEQFDRLRNEKAAGTLTEEEFWKQLASHLAARGISEEQVNRILEER